jgi:hypothetical protein
MIARRWSGSSTISHSEHITSSSSSVCASMELIRAPPALCARARRRVRTSSQTALDAARVACCTAEGSPWRSVLRHGVQARRPAEKRGQRASGGRRGARTHVLQHVEEKGQNMPEAAGRLRVGGLCAGGCSGTSARLGRSHGTGEGAPSSGAMASRISSLCVTSCSAHTTRPSAP